MLYAHMWGCVPENEKYYKRGREKFPFSELTNDL